MMAMKQNGYVVLIVLAIIMAMSIGGHTVQAGNTGYFELTSCFDGGIKYNMTTCTDRYNISDGCLTLDMPCASKDDDLESYWRFENNTIDETFNNNGTCFGAANATGKFGNAFSFDGTNDYVKCGDAGGFETTNSFSLECWFKSPTMASTQVIMSKSSISPPAYKGYGLYALSSTGNLRFSMIANRSAMELIAVDYESDVCDDNWHHCVLTYNGSTFASGVHIYVDGGDKNLTTVSDNLAGTILVRQKFQVSGQDGANTCFNGLIDEVKIYNRTLNATEVEEHYNSGNQYKTEGNWTSANITKPLADTLTSFEFVLSYGNDTNYIDKVEIIDAGNGILISTCDMNFTSTTIISSDFDNGLGDTKDTPVQIILSFVGDGSRSIALESLVWLSTSPPIPLAPTTSDDGADIGIPPLDTVEDSEGHNNDGFDICSLAVLPLIVVPIGAVGMLERKRRKYEK